MSVEIPKVGQGNAKPANDLELDKDEKGFTHPNLHRRIVQPSTLTPAESYMLGIYSLDSYRTTETHLHDEDATETEVP